MSLTLMDTNGVRRRETGDACGEARVELTSVATADERYGETSRAFFSFLAALSLFVISLNVSGLDRARPAVALFWLLVGGLSAFMAFGKKARGAD